MIEPIMYFGIGFLVAALIGLVIVPLVHNRAVRLTVRRLEAATPLSMAEIQADKDQLRAEFAMATRRLEMTLEQFKLKNTSQLAELGKKSDAINRLKMELGEKTATIFALEARDKALRDQLRATEEELAGKTTAMSDAQRTVSQKEVELARLSDQLDERSHVAQAQKVDIIALSSQVETLRKRLTEAGDELKAVKERRDAERVELRKATRELAEERGRVGDLSRRVAQLEQTVVAQKTEVEVAGRRSQDLEIRLGEQVRRLSESAFEAKQLRNALEAAQKTESELREALAELEARATSVHQKLNSENAQIEAELDHTRKDRDRMAVELASLKRDSEQNWANERGENALLRERISDVAAEVARLASAMEGPNSTIESILATEAARDRSTTIAPVTVHADMEFRGQGSGSLADRIRALQAGRLASEEPQTRN
jgi:chromosome segregation ATPase